MTAPALFPFPRETTRPLDPPPSYSELARVSRIPRIETPRGPAWLVTHHDDCRMVLNSRDFSSDPRTPGFPTYIAGDVPPPPGFFLQLDPPDQPRLRRLVTREFVVTRMEALRPRMREVFDDCVDRMTQNASEGDFVAQVAYPMAATTICELVDVPVSDKDEFIGLTDIVLDRSSTPKQATAAAQSLMGYFDELVARRKTEHKDDLLGRLVRHEQAGLITHDELAGLVALLVLSGYDTMAQTIGLGTLLLLTHPEQNELLRDQPSLIGNAVEEMLRYLSINHAGLPRAALVDVCIGGQRISAGDGVLVMLNAANRDNHVFDDPDSFRIDRDDATQHIAFGHGFHKCIGLTMARVELSEVFTGVNRRLPNLTLGADPSALEFRDDMVLYGVNRLPVSW